MSYEFKETLLKVSNINLTLGENQIIRNLSVEIKDVVRPGHVTGQIIGFIAPSGLGKTKFFECLSGIRKPDSGEILIGSPLEPTKIGKVGVVQQNYPLFNNRTVISNMRVAASQKYKNKKERNQKVDEMIERVGLSGRKKAYPHQLSGGQKQRAAIAQQLLCSNSFLLMDEPFSGLDINMIKEVSDIIKEVAHADEKNTIIIVSHDIVSTAAISDTIWVMGRERDENGKIIPGAMIKYEYDLMERGLAWRDDVESLPAFNELINDIKSKFKSL